MYFATISVLLLALQVNYSSAACNGAISSDAPRPQSTPPAQPSILSSQSNSILAVTSTIPTNATKENTNNGAIGDSRIASNLNGGDMSELFQSNLSSSVNDSIHNRSQLMETNGTNSRAGNDDVSMREVNEFRLEYNKYKILSHLSITGNLDEIDHDIDDGVRKQLVQTTALANQNNSPSSSARHKRSLSCGEVKSDKNTCCLESFYINFTHIGWDKWILYPTGYNANYCRGQCDLSHARQVAPLKLLYIDEENKVHQKSIPDMIVESCDCA